MDPMEPHAEQWPLYDEDRNESFTGPEGLANLFNDEEDDEEYYDDGDEGGSHHDEPLETSASQRDDPVETSQADTVSGHTQSSMQLSREGCTP